jgi:hypothetical protein
MPQEVTLAGVLSGTQVTLDRDVIAELVKSYLLVIPNEKRELGMAIRVTKMAEDLMNLSKAEGYAAEHYIERKMALEPLIEMEPEPTLEEGGIENGEESSGAQDGEVSQGGDH